MATIQQIIHDIEYPRIPPIAGTPEEDRLIELWRWGILAQIYARISINQFQFNVAEIQEDVNQIWSAAVTYVENEKDGIAEIIDLFPFMVNAAIARVEPAQPFELDRVVELTDEERAMIDAWVSKGIYYAIWKRFEDRTPGSDMLGRIRVWIEGKIVRDFSTEALQDMRFLIAVSLQTFKSIINGTLKIQTLGA